MQSSLLPFSVCLLLAGCSITHQSETSATRADHAVTNSFAIYLTTERVDPTFAATNLAEVKLLSLPVISDADIVAADFESGVLRLRPEALKRLPKASVHGTLFVAVVDGERLFLGAFWTSLSSFGPVAAAMIQSDQVLGQDYVFLGWHDFAARGGVGWGGPWSDPRIKQCLGKLHKLGHVKTALRTFTTGTYPTDATRPGF